MNQQRIRTGNLAAWGLVCAFWLSGASLAAADLDLYIGLPKKMPEGEWKMYLGEIGSDTVASYKLGAEGKPQSTVSIVWMQELYNSRAMLEKAAPALKKILTTSIHKGSKPDTEKLPPHSSVFGLTGEEKEDSLILFYEFKQAKDSEEHKAGTYRYYYIFKPVDEKTSISLGVEVQIHDPGHVDSINSLLLACTIRTPAEVAAE
ncbi:MAG TPA: hypothetical protein VL860_14075, partial [Planctomycetota bacterium]|nr:hypothetical protein [Planctomycetota bacterium]